MSRELVQLEDLLQWAESVHGTSDDNVKEATQVKSEANNVLKVCTLDSLLNLDVSISMLSRYECWPVYMYFPVYSPHFVQCFVTVRLVYAYMYTL